MVSKVRFNAEEDDSAIVTRHPARSQMSIARSRNCVYVVAAQKLPPTSGGYSAVSARTPAPQDLPQVAKLRLGGVGVATSGHVLQAHGSDVLLSHATHFQRRLVAAARSFTADPHPTHASER